MISNEFRTPEQTPQMTPTESSRAESDGMFSRRLIAPDTSELAPLRTWIDALLLSDVADQERQLLLVAITEAVTNAIEAHRRGGVDAAIKIDVDRSSRLVAVEDYGGGLGPEDVEDPTTPAPSAARGRGLLIIRSICPTARFLQTEAGARVELPFSS